MVGIKEDSSLTMHGTAEVVIYTAVKVNGRVIRNIRVLTKEFKK